MGLRHWRELHYYGEHEAGTRTSRSLFDELDLTLHVLKGTGNLTFEHMRKAGPNPAYTQRPPTQIVTDYLSKISECSRKVIDIEQLVRTKTPVDIMITVPVVGEAVQVHNVEIC